MADPISMELKGQLKFLLLAVVICSINTWHDTRGNWLLEWVLRIIAPLHEHCNKHQRSFWAISSTRVSLEWSVPTTVWLGNLKLALEWKWQLLLGEQGYPHTSLGLGSPLVRKVNCSTESPFLPQPMSTTQTMSIHKQLEQTSSTQTLEAGSCKTKG